MRLPEAVSRLAAPFFGSQAEPSSRQRGMLRANGSVCLAFSEITYCLKLMCIGVVVYVWPMHGVILSASAPIHRFTPHRVMVGSCIFSVCVTHVTGIALEASTVNISLSLPIVCVGRRCFGRLCLRFCMCTPIFSGASPI